MIKTGLLSNIARIRKLDKANMLNIILGLPDQCASAVNIADCFKAPPGYSAKNFDKVLFAGVGGSAIGADIIKSYLTASMDRPIIVNRNYDIPAFVDKKTFVFVSSYSGNTEETLSAYRQIKLTGAKIVVITSGGKLGSLAQQDKIPSILIPGGLPPREALGYMSIVPLVGLSAAGFIKRQDRQLREVVKLLTELREAVLPVDVPISRNIAKQIAAAVFGRFLIVYGPEDYLGGAVTRWRQEFEENSKIVCSSAVLPEMNHNEITGWEDPVRICKDTAIILLRDKGEHPRVSRRIDISRELIGKITPHIIQVHSKGEGLLARMFYLIYIGTFASFYLAILNQIDPTPVDNVTYLKNKLSNR